MTDLKDFHDNLDRMNAAQSKVNMQNNMDNFAIDFTKWIIINCNHKKMEYLDLKELLEIFKKERI